MADEERMELADHLIELSQESSDKGDRMAACNHLLNCLNVMPEYKPDLKQQLLHRLYVLAYNVDDQSQDCLHLLEFYLEAVRIYDCEEVFSEIGSFLLRLNFADQAAFHFLEALKRNEIYMLALRGLNSAYCALFKRWHYRMLNDEGRNEGFQKAIAKKVLRGHSSVLDIGTGTGLFCLYAVDAGADKVYGHDYSPATISIANRVLDHLGPSATRVKLIQKPSRRRLSIPKDIPERVSLVVTETMDAGLLGEHLLQTVSHAWKNLLLPPPISGLDSSTPSGAFIPQSGSVWFRLVQSRELARHYMFPVSNFDGSPSSLQNLRFGSLFVKRKKPYDSERLRTFSDLEYMTEPQRLLHIDFNNPDDVDEHLLNRNQTLTSVRCSVEGEVHAVVAWFRVQVDENIELSSQPDGANADTCYWEQAVFPFARAYRVVPESIVYLLTELIKDKISLSMNRIDYPDESKFLLSLGLPAPSSFVWMLNDSNLMEQLRIAAEKFIEEKGAYEEIHVLDTFPVPVFGLLVMRHLIRLNESLRPRLYCIAKSSLAKRATETIALSNQIPLDAIQWIAGDDFPLKIPPVRFDAMVLDVLDKNGDLKEKTILCMEQIRDMLKPDGVLLPSKLEVCGQLVYSEYIEKNTRVVSPMLERMGIAEAINKYQVSQMFDMNLPSLPCSVRSNPFVCHSFTPAELENNEYKELFVVPTETGSVNAILYWYNMFFGGDGPAHSYSTCSRFSYVHQAAFVLKLPILISKDNETNLTFCHSDCFFMINPTVL